MTQPTLSTFGALKEGDLYIERPADEELLHALQRSEYAYVLASRQTGKTSLVTRTMRKLSAQGTRCVKLDMGAFAFEGTTDDWYLTLACEIAMCLGQKSEFAESLFARYARRPPTQRFTRFLQEALRLVDTPLVLFLDEVESFLKMPGPVADGFLTAIRSYVNDRDRTPLYRRLSFCLSGVCTPTELIQDERRTPFNVARGIALEDFTWEPVRDGFLPFFAHHGPEAEATLARIYHWTQGHPYLTHRLCKELFDREVDAAALVPALVDRLVREIFLGSLGREQENLLEVERRFCVGQPHRVQRRLALYRRLLQGEKIPARGNDPSHLELRLCGLAKEQRVPGEPPRLALRNPIFSSVFDASWVPQTQPAKLDPALWLKDQTQRWIEFGRKDAFVLYGEELREAQAWADRQSLLEPQSAEFLRASRRVDARERALRLNSLLLTILFSSFSSFLLSQLLPTYWHQRAYPFESAIQFLYGLAFVLALPSGLFADRQRLESVSISLGGFGCILTGALLLLADSFIGSSALALASVGLVAAGQSICRPHQAVLLSSLFPQADRRISTAFMAFYFVVNAGGLLGPLVGTSLLQSYGWAGPLLAASVGYAIAIGLLATARHAFERTRLVHQTPSSATPSFIEQSHQQTQKLALLGLVSFLFWTGFYAYGRWSPEPTHATATRPLSGMDVILQSLSLDTITTLFVLLVAPLFMAWEWLAARRRLRPHVTLRVIAALALLALLFLRMLLRPSAAAAPLSDYLVLSTAELLIVPVSMSLAAALAPSGLQCSTMGAYYFLIGIAVWIPKLLPNPSWVGVALLSAMSVLLAVWASRAGWDRLLQTIRTRSRIGLSG
ncbi:MAG: MFS transporter [Polyangia bacterium]